MHLRALVSIALLLLPAASDAQRFPMPRIGRGPGRPAPLPPQAPEIARQLAYMRLPLAIESYSLISHFQSSSIVQGVPSSWTSMGMGTRADYRVTRSLSATLDMTSSFVGGPALTQTLELGTRLRPERSERKAYPFVDLRAGYMHSYYVNSRPMRYVDPYAPTASYGIGASYSHGLGGAAGAGMEYALTPTLSLISAGSVLRAHMAGRGYGVARPSPDRFGMTAYRYMAGIRYNPVRFIRTPATELPASSAAR